MPVVLRERRLALCTSLGRHVNMTRGMCLGILVSLEACFVNRKGLPLLSDTSKVSSRICSSGLTSHASVLTGRTPADLWSFLKPLYHSSVQFSSIAQSCPTLRPHESQQARPPCPTPTPGVHSDSRPSSQ